MLGVRREKHDCRRVEVENQFKARRKSPFIRAARPRADWRAILRDRGGQVFRGAR
jgi:hypothetical protein